MKLEVWGSEAVLKHPKKATMLAAWPEFEKSVQPVKGDEQGRLVLIDVDEDPPEVVALDPNLDETVVTVVTKAAGIPGSGPVVTPPGRG